MRAPRRFHGRGSLVRPVFARSSSAIRKLEDPARVLLRLIRAEENALLASPVEDRDVRLRHQHLHRRPAPPRPGQAVDDAVDDRQREKRQREPHQDLLRDRAPCRAA